MALVPGAFEITHTQVTTPVRSKVTFATQHNTVQNQDASMHAERNLKCDHRPTMNNTLKPTLTDDAAPIVE